MQELLVIGVEFSDLGMVKIEVEHPVPDLDNLLGRLDEQRPSNWEIPAFPGQYMEEIGLADYVQATLMDPAVEVAVVHIWEHTYLQCWNRRSL